MYKNLLGLSKGLVGTVYEREYFVGANIRILFGYASIFYPMNAWFRFRKVASLIRRFGGKGNTLDVGCALGDSLVRFESIGLKPVGCDISAWATKRARKIHPHISIIRADALALPFRSGAFDTVTAFETLEHCSDLDLALREIERVIKPGGLVITSVPTTDLNRTYDDETHLWHKSLREWLTLFKSHFRILSVDFFMEFMKYVDGKTCNTFITLRTRKD